MRVTDVVLIGIDMVTATAPAATSTVAQDDPALVRAHPGMIDTTALSAGIEMMIDALAVDMAAVTVLVGPPPNLLSSMRMSETSEPSSCSSLLRA